MAPSQPAAVAAPPPRKLSPAVHAAIGAFAVRCRAGSSLPPAAIARPASSCLRLPADEHPFAPDPAFFRVASNA